MSNSNANLPNCNSPKHVSHQDGLDYGEQTSMKDSNVNRVAQEDGIQHEVVFFFFWLFFLNTVSTRFSFNPVKDLLATRS